MNFQVGQIVKGHIAGTFQIIGFCTLGGEKHAKLKSYDPATGRVERGQLALPLTALRA